MMVEVLASRSGKMKLAKGEMMSGEGVCEGGSAGISDKDYKITVDSD